MFCTSCCSNIVDEGRRFAATADMIGQRHGLPQARLWEQRWPCWSGQLKVDDGRPGPGALCPRSKSCKSASRSIIRD
jgi:hypothetical protein